MATKPEKVYTADGKLNSVTFEFIGDVNCVKVEHTNEGVKVTGSFASGGLQEIQVKERSVDAAPEPEKKPVKSGVTKSK